jgi:glycogen operon protein
MRIAAIAPAWRRGAGATLSFDRRDNAWAMLKSRVVDSAATWGDDRPLRTPWTDTVILEAHVKGFTAMNPGVPPELRGTYAGFAHPASIARIRTLGVTAVELLPIHEFIDERMLVQNDSSTIGVTTRSAFSRRLRAYAGGGDPLVEFRAMVRALHRAGIEVILDVVYNHTAESNEFGPTLAFRGIDNSSYYRLRADGARWYDDLTGVGNTLNAANPHVLKMISIRCAGGSPTCTSTASASTWRRRSRATAPGFDPGCAFLDALRQDPCCARSS